MTQRRILLAGSLFLVMAACETADDQQSVARGSSQAAEPPPVARPLPAADTTRTPEPSHLAGITDEHNVVRRRVDPPLPALEWSDDLARTARAWANQCRFEHNSGRGELGENLAAFTDATGSARKSVWNWAAEAADYDYASNTCKPGRVCAHYTQIVWWSTKKLGCAAASCTKNSPFPGFTNWQIWVCNYSPPGNYIGQRPY